ncbi:Reverse transcriptase (RNA-dependent DNA polymerase) [Nesidiocoris tenuis]|uniref:Reverse transcriptase (RNA-dependent DNA polymerase) n=1 Tax=Nesidiocoris tenuis TaxID=355587 RepID=A0ABN7AKA6_9HEMI|nr:Reverse transcriptase (RNA-dependent DNA polymerase) [Nesidiocoris tenuis]
MSRSNTPSPEPKPDPDVHDENEEVNVVRLKLPPFWTEHPEIWFYQVEAQFVNEKLRTENAKFNQLIANLEPKYLENVWDIITDSTQQTKYTSCKHRLLEVFKESDEKQLKKLLTGVELGDSKPSQLLRKMKSLAGKNFSNKAMKTLWLDKLPESVRNILIVSEENMDKLAVMADRIFEINPNRELYPVTTDKAVSSRHEHQPIVPTDQVAVLTAQISALAKQIEELQANFRSRNPVPGRSLRRYRSRSRSRSRAYDPKGKYCYSHFRYGAKCYPEKCTPPCSWSSENGPRQGK